MPEQLLADDSIIFQEMMSHPALFSHPHPKIIAVIGDETGGILREILKHPNVAQAWNVTNKPVSEHFQDDRAHYFAGSLSDWTASIAPESIDILINAVTLETSHLKLFLNTLHIDGMLIQRGCSTFKLQKLKTIQEKLIKADFSDIHFLSFAQPHFPSGWQTALIAIKQGNMHRIREKDIFNKTFNTHYYNFDMHKASLVLPEFMRQELEPIYE